MNAKDLLKLVLEHKLSIKDVFKLAEEGKRGEAEALMKVLKEVAKYHPTEIIQITGRPAIYKCGGKFVVLDENGVWKLKNPPQRKLKKTPHSKSPC